MVYFLYEAWDWLDTIPEFLEFRVIFTTLDLSQLLGYLISAQMYIRRANEPSIIISSLQDGRKSI